jgi:hypothetical protein
MLTTLEFNFLYYKLQLYFIYHVHYTPFACDKFFLKFQDFQTYFEFLKFTNSTFCVCFLIVNNMLLSFQFNLFVVHYKIGAQHYQNQQNHTHKNMHTN